MRGKGTAGYSLINEVNVGDIVFHYDTSGNAIAGCSVAAGGAVEGETIWVTHRAASRKRYVISTAAQPGWFLNLEGMYPLEEPLILETLRGRAGDVMAIQAGLKAAYPGLPIYYPFYLYGGTTLRAM